MVEGCVIKRNLKLVRPWAWEITSTANNDSTVASDRTITLGVLPQFPFLNARVCSAGLSRRLSALAILNFLKDQKK